jgi:hypothetical protein
VFGESGGPACRPLELFQRRGGGRLASGYELLGRQLHFEPIEGRAGGDGVGRGELLVSDRERKDHGGPLLFGRIFGEAGADPGECEKFAVQRASTPGRTTGRST